MVGHPTHGRAPNSRKQGPSECSGGGLNPAWAHQLVTGFSPLCAKKCGTVLKISKGHTSLLSIDAASPPFCLHSAIHHDGDRMAEWWHRFHNDTTGYHGCLMCKTRVFLKKKCRETCLFTSWLAPLWKLPFHVSSFTASYCLLLPLTASYCLLLPLTASYCLLLPLTASYCLLLPLTASLAAIAADRPFWELSPFKMAKFGPCRVFLRRSAVNFFRLFFFSSKMLFFTPKLHSWR